MRMMYKGESSVSFENGRVYNAIMIHDDMGDGYSIRDESLEWYRYGRDFVSENFNAENEISYRRSAAAVSNATG